LVSGGNTARDLKSPAIRIPNEPSHCKLAEKVNKMENDLNLLRELCQKQNHSLSTILHRNKKPHRSKSIGDTVTLHESSKSKKYKYPMSSLNKKFQSLFRNTTPEVFSIENSQSQNALKFHINKLAVRPDQQYHSQEKVSSSTLILIDSKCKIEELSKPGQSEKDKEE
jgi:hypothetical protein